MKFYSPIDGFLLNSWFKKTMTFISPVILLCFCLLFFFMQKLLDVSEKKLLWLATGFKNWLENTKHEDKFENSQKE